MTTTVDIHTPGPWTVEAGREPVTHQINVVAGPYRGNRPEWYVAGVIAGMDESTQQANARLIAAAPDLLEALKVADARLTKVANALGAEKLFWVDDIETVRTAIAKATGAA